MWKLWSVGVGVHRLFFVLAVSATCAISGWQESASAAPKNKTVASSSSSTFNFDPASERDFVALLCNDGEYFRECFSSTRTACVSALKAEVKTCKDTVKSKKIKMTSEVQLFAEIGVCVGDGIEKKWRNQKTNSPKCDKKENWR